MVSYTCEKCFKVFNKKCDFTRHTEHRKTPCKGNFEISTKKHIPLFQSTKKHNPPFLIIEKNIPLCTDHKKAHSAFLKTHNNDHDYKIISNNRLVLV